MADLPISSLLKRGEMKILFVEDDKFLRALLSEKLRTEGYTVMEAENGEEGISLVHTGRPHLVLLDLILPGKIDGYELLKQMKAEPTLSSIPVVIISNLGSAEDIDRAMNLGAKDFLVKVRNTPQEVVSRIRRIIEESYLRR